MRHASFSLFFVQSGLFVANKPLLTGFAAFFAITCCERPYVEVLSRFRMLFFHLTVFGLLRT